MRVVWMVGLVVLSVLGGVPAQADYTWYPRFTAESDPALQKLHGAIGMSDLGGTKGIPVTDLRWSQGSFELRMRSGAIWLEPGIDGASTGVYFEGDGTVRYSPAGAQPKGVLTFWFGTPALTEATVKRAYLFLPGTDILRTLGAQGEPTVPQPNPAGYLECKSIVRQLGLGPSHAFLNREGRSKGAAWAVLPVDQLRTSRNESAALVYSFDPGRRETVMLQALGSDALAPEGPFKYLAWTLVRERPKAASFQPAAKVQVYSTRLEMPERLSSLRAETTIRMTPAEGVRGLALTLSPRLRVSEVLGPGGQRLPHAQWTFLGDRPNPDSTLLVDLGPAATPGAEMELVVRSSGSIFEAAGAEWRLAEEDHWYPSVDVFESSLFELFVSVPKKQRAVAPGEKISEEVVGDVRSYHYRTTVPQRGSTFYCGAFDVHQGTVDKTKVEVYRDRNAPAANLTQVADPEMGIENLPTVGGYSEAKFMLQEVENAVLTFNRILLPLELPSLRVASTPTSHGRGFQGLLLLSRGGFRSDLSLADLFRAHEVAHMWWGNLSEPRDWPEDRWLSESFAEYSAMEFYKLRFKKPEEARNWMYQAWVKPVLEASKEPQKTLTGQVRRVRSSEMRPLADGTQNVYTKGPLVLHQLRNLFVLFKGNDNGFWELLQDFLEQNRGELVTTQDFITATETKLGGQITWFWDQWLYGSELPEVRWTHTVAQQGSEWVVTVDARQIGTAYQLPIPVYVELEKGKRARAFLNLSGATGRAQVKVPAKPRSVSLNDNYEVLASVQKE